MKLPACFIAAPVVVAISGYGTAILLGPQINAQFFSYPRGEWARPAAK